MAVNPHASAEASSGTKGRQFDLSGGRPHFWKADMTILNESSLRFITQSLKTSRLALLRSKARLHCHSHGIQAVTDVYPNKTVLLACGCRRQSSLRTQEEIAAFDAAVAEAQRRRRINSGKSCGNQWTKIYVEDVEEIAA
jgi:hypothetical protein